MNKNDIIEALVCGVKDRLENREVEHRTVTKNNGIVYDAISIQFHNADTVFANVYVDEKLDEIMEGKATLTATIEWILAAYTHAEKRDNINERVAKYMRDKDFILHHVHRNLVNKDKNLEYLDLYPHKEFLDMLIIYRIQLSSEMTIRMTNTLMEANNISMEELDIASKRNDCTSWIFHSMGEEIRKLSGNKCFENFVLDNLIMVVTRDTRDYGAAAITDKSFMEDVAEQFDGDFYIVPVSIHECFLASYALWEDDADKLKEVVKSANAEIEAGDVLSDSVYIYHKETKTIEIA